VNWQRQHFGSLLFKKSSSILKSVELISSKLLESFEFAGFLFGKIETSEKSPYLKQSWSSLPAVTFDFIVKLLSAGFNKCTVEFWIKMLSRYEIYK
jgi:hypothetical protein